jgi:uncharacterized protein (TIGR01777 family)
MRIVIAGGTGQIGTILARHYHARGDDVTVLSRRPAAAPWTLSTWDPSARGPWTWTKDGPGPWMWAIDGADIVINLAGRSVNCRYNDWNRREIMQSRLESTRILGEAISHAKSPPRLWLQASTATIYSHRFDAPNDDITGHLGGDEPGVPDTWRFSIDVAKSWEAELDKADTPRTRKVAMRSAMVMSPDRGGIFEVLVGLVRKGLGGSAGNGKQFVSWIHDQDFIRAVDWLIEHDLSGPVNIASPNPLPYSDFMRTLRRALLVPIGLPATRWMLELGAILMKTETELVLKSRRVVPRRLLDSGFTFNFPDWPAAAADLVSRRRRSRSTSAVPITG